MQTYEVFARKSDPRDERLLEVLLDRRVSFVEIQLGDRDAEALEGVAGSKLPFVRRGERVVGGFSELINDLRIPPARQRPRSSPPC